MLTAVERLTWQQSDINDVDKILLCNGIMVCMNGRAHYPFSPFAHPFQHYALNLLHRLQRLLLIHSGALLALYLLCEASSFKGRYMVLRTVQWITQCSVCSVCEALQRGLLKGKVTGTHKNVHFGSSISRQTACVVNMLAKSSDPLCKPYFPRFLIYKSAVFGQAFWP